jgi:histidyl-tRNA synthetase
MIEPRTLKGFRDYLPEVMLPREELMATARRVYRSYGFAPIDTPALEYIEILTGKGSDETDKQLYRFVDHGGREVGLRFDLTVPLARFAAQYAQQLAAPFKRYHIAPVWRGENTQRGRLREFVQCDFDTIGTESVVADIETACVIHDLLRAIGFEAFSIRMNNRAVLNGLLDKLGLAESRVAVLRALDKLAKIGANKVVAEMIETAGATNQQATQIVGLAGVTGTPDSVLAEVDKLVAGSETGEAGVARLREILAGAQAGGVAPARLALDVSIARGLDYYTGVIFETFLDELPEIGSVCSGGRYDNLAELFTKTRLPGVGASLGLDRLLVAMEELGLVPQVATPAQVLVTQFTPAGLPQYLQLASSMRRAGLGVELFPEAKKIGKQLQHANRRGHRLAVIAGPDELAAGECQIKDLASGESRTVACSDAAATALDMLTPR